MVGKRVSSVLNLGLSSVNTVGREPISRSSFEGFVESLGSLLTLNALRLVVLKRG
jgi:hypothetical protein